MLRRTLCFSLLLLIGHSVSAEEPSELVDRCDDELFYFGADIDEVSRRAKAVVDWGEKNQSEAIECRGLIRMVYAELYFGRWRNEWDQKRKKAAEIASELPGDSTGLADFLMFNGYLKATFFEDIDGGIADLRHAIAIGEANDDLRLLAEAHFLCAKAESLRGAYASLDHSARSYRLAAHQMLPRLEHLALRSLISIKIIGKFDASNDVARYHQLCRELGLPIDMHAVVETDVQEMLEIASRTSYSVDASQQLDADEIISESRKAADLTRDRRDLVKASYYLVEHFGTELNDWERAAPYLDLMEKAAQQLLDATYLNFAKHYRSLVLAREGKIAEARRLSQEVLDNLQDQGDSETILTLAKDQMLAFALGGSFEDTQRLLELLRTQQANLDAKIPGAADVNAEIYCDLLISKAESRREAEEQRAATLQTRIINASLAVGFPILIICSWLWQRAAQGRRMQTELREQLDLKTKSLRQATEKAEQANRAKSDYLARINHELRSPLGAIISGCELMALAADDGKEELVGDARKLVSSASRVIVDVVDDVLDFTRIEANQLEFHPSAFSPIEMLETVSSIAAPQLQERVRWITRVDPKLPAIIRTDLPKLRQTILNACSNAAKYTSQGQVAIELKYSPSEQEGANGELIVQIEDTGSGIDAELLPHIFERFRKDGDHAGSGLGLFISRAFAECMGGRMECHSTVGVGTTVILNVPIAIGDAETGRVREHPESGTRLQRVLVVDDIDRNRRALSALLKMLDFEPFTAKNWEEVVPHLDAGVDCVLLDLRMPRIDGFEMIRRFLAHYPNGRRPKLIAVSGDSTQATRDEAHAAGFDGFLAKPFRKEELIAAICSDGGAFERIDSLT